MKIWLRLGWRQIDVEADDADDADNDGAEEADEAADQNADEDENNWPKSIIFTHLSLCEYNLSSTTFGITHATWNYNSSILL